MPLQFLWARLRGLLHLLSRHDLEWKAGVDFDICAGDIVCHSCDLTIWCRWYDPRWLGGGKGKI